MPRLLACGRIKTAEGGNAGRERRDQRSAAAGLLTAANRVRSAARTRIIVPVCLRRARPAGSAIDASRIRETGIPVRQTREIILLPREGRWRGTSRQALEQYKTIARVKRRDKAVSI